VPITVAQCVVITFLTNENVGPNEIWCRLCAQYGESTTPKDTNENVGPNEIWCRLRAQYGESTLSKTQVKFWHKEFRGGREAMQNTSHQRCPRTSTSTENITAVHDLIEGNRRLTVFEICQELGTRISYGNVQSIIKNELLLRKSSA